MPMGAVIQKGGKGLGRETDDRSLVREVNNSKLQYSFHLLMDPLVIDFSVELLRDGI